jgi:hypothetical protein
MKSKQRCKRYWLVILGSSLMLMLILAGCGGSLNAGGDVPVSEVIPTDTAVPEPSPTPTEEPAEEEIPAPAAVVSAAKLVGAGPVIDGTISPGEWDEAFVARYEDGSELMLAHANGVLYLAVRASGPEMIMGNFFIQRGEEVSVLHASAALGTAKYAYSDGSWNLTQNFDWRCRDAGFSERAQAERDEFLQTDGWVAANSMMGAPNELEYQITAADEITAMAVIFVQELVPMPFPVGLDDACVSTYPEGLPDEMAFDIGNWVGLELAGD